MRPSASREAAHARRPRLQDLVNLDAIADGVTPDTDPDPSPPGGRRSSRRWPRPPSTRRSPPGRTPARCDPAHLRRRGAVDRLARCRRAGGCPAHRAPAAGRAMIGVAADPLWLPRRRLRVLSGPCRGAVYVVIGSTLGARTALGLARCIGFAFIERWSRTGPIVARLRDARSQTWLTPLVFASRSVRLDRRRQLPRRPHAPRLPALRAGHPRRRRTNQRPYRRGDRVGVPGDDRPRDPRGPRHAAADRMEGRPRRAARGADGAIRELLSLQIAKPAVPRSARPSSGKQVFLRRFELEPCMPVITRDA